MNSLDIKIEELIKSIENSPEYLTLVKKETILANDLELMKLIRELKSLQKKSVIKPSLETSNLLTDKLYYLNNQDKYIEYLNALDNFNKVSNLINQKLDHYINTIVELK